MAKTIKVIIKKLQSLKNQSKHTRKMLRKYEPDITLLKPFLYIKNYLF